MDGSRACLGKLCFPDTGTAPCFRPLPPSSCLGSRHPTPQLSNHLTAQRQRARGQRMAANSTKGHESLMIIQRESRRPDPRGFSFNSPPSVGFFSYLPPNAHLLRQCPITRQRVRAARSGSWEEPRLPGEGEWERSYSQQSTLWT